MVFELGELDCRRTSLRRRIGRHCSALVIVQGSVDPVKIALAMDLATSICQRAADALKCVGKSFIDAILIFPDVVIALAKLYFVLVTKIPCKFAIFGTFLLKVRVRR